MNGRDRIILFPFMAQGHLIPFLALATHLEHRTGYTITIVNTPLNIKTLKSSLPPTTTIHLVSLPFNGSDHSLPPNSESTDALPHHLLPRLYHSSQTLQPSFENLISTLTNQDGHPPLCIISDMFLGWTVQIANRLGIFHSIFITGGAHGASIDFTLYLDPNSQPDSAEFQLPGFPDSFRVHRSQLKIADDSSDSDSMFRFIHLQFNLCLSSDGFLFNTVEEMEKIGLEYFRKKTNRPVWAIGLLKNEGIARKAIDVSAGRCISWLDFHRPNSVLYVSFGSQNTISVSQMMELAMGLESSGTKFIWVVRAPHGFDVDGEFRTEEWLPEGFEERITERKQGMLVKRWAPQLEILSHGSTGGFLSHCGWNSTVESLRRGVPVIGWPMSAEQFYNAKMMEELGVCVVGRGEGMEIGRSEVVRVIEMVMGGKEKGEEMKRKGLKVKEMIEEAVREDGGSLGSSVKALGDFVMAAVSSKKMIGGDF
ncbi:UDP-glycosyltransferase 92A1-like [Magnolia sinica]|uniref:UDP-glycosyltransferase 92A1-like n=1 Tax=Magnolia sinica TaxID=86752 RepID=UPI00265A4A6B|nr:UDP-glycosyltransferase 92A1-like [Magnolia sinica]